MIEVLAGFGLVVIWTITGVMICDYGLTILEAFTDDLSKFSLLDRLRVRCFGIILSVCVVMLLITSIALTVKYFQSDTKVSVTLIPPSVEVEKK